ncbi:conserved phage C-terminal domain-containing protein [Companilactobacillus allii]|uniref:Phage conserved hypothetical protein C-terminal domain-containing protein n=1 Tax=Companilactobacillus allii TaxID=1847728 RepID=A0A1P8Q4U8_9LACO|nr:conserved phage C-terminal domain-containing protein [Companilactobacillus allii]APX72883.1 hypothetical protein BTM29_10110 [Companilactobacillus allii]USQ67671.1 conserved phage C-terminal domain-containing protein [Companilactobacillus allii]
MSEEISRDFKGIWIPKEIWLDKELTKSQMLLYVEIDSLSSNEKGCFASNNYLSKFLRVSPSRISQLVSELEKKNYITVKLFYSKDNPKLVARREITPVNILNRVVNILIPPTKKIKGGYLENCEEREPSSDNQKHIKDNVELPRPSPPDSIPFKKIIEYLNSKAEKHYRLAETNKLKITERWNEGYRLEDFKKVIDNKCLVWKDDSKMNEYLRPYTLFGKKFDDYLNSKPIDESSNRKVKRIEQADDWSKVKPTMTNEEYLKKHAELMQQLKIRRSKELNHE